MKESRAKYPITILQTVLDGEYSFQKEYGKFTDKLEDAGFFGSGTDIEVYITKDNLPYDLAEKIGIENAPYFNESEFRFIFLFKKMKDNQDNMIWMLNNKGQKKMLYKY